MTETQQDAPALDADHVARALVVGVGMLTRRLRQTRTDGDLTLPQASALARLDRGGPATVTELARREQISPQSMGATIAALEARDLVARTPDPDDGRQSVVAVTGAGLELLRRRRNARSELLAQTLARDFTRAELRTLVAAAPLLERLAQGI